jgi:hypothetical protein
MLKFASKFLLEKIFPSVIATVAGAYIVNHYIVNKPADAPAASIEAKADPRVDLKTIVDKAAAGTPDGTRHVANIPESGVRAKGISEKAVERTPVEKVIEKTVRPAEAASHAEEPKRHPQAREQAQREKAVAKATPAEAVSSPDERRDATDLARAAIERLRGTNEAARSQEAAPRPPEPPRVAVQEASRAVPPSIQPLPPAIMVSAPPAETADPQSEPEVRRVDPRRPIPPADIPEGLRPLDLQAKAEMPATRNRDTTVTDDVLSAAKSVFQAVLPR